MATVELYNANGERKGTIDLIDSLFGVEVKPAVVHQALVTQAANSRVAVAHTKTRAEVAGTGKKPWKQKGTGRARHGSRRSPIWVGGGITFGPRNDRNFSLKMNKQARRAALAMALSDKVEQGQLLAVESILVADGKTKTLASLLTKLPLKGKKTLVITEPANKGVAKAAQNVRNLETLPANALNVIDLLRFDQVVMSVPAIEVITKLYKRA